MSVSHYHIFIRNSTRAFYFILYWQVGRSLLYLYLNILKIKRKSLLLCALFPPLALFLSVNGTAIANPTPLRLSLSYTLALTLIIFSIYFYLSFYLFVCHSHQVISPLFNFCGEASHAIMFISSLLLSLLLLLLLQYLFDDVSL